MVLRRIIPILVLFLLLGGCQSPPLSRTDFLLDTFVTVTLYGSDDSQILDGALEICRTYDAMFNRHSSDSELYQLNNSPGEPQTVSPQLYQLLEEALSYCHLSDGRYDITIAPVMDLWDFHGEDAAPPSPQALEEALALVDYRNVILKDGTVQLLNGAQIDLGSIAKGYIADQMAEYLREEEVPGALLNLGGNVLAVGAKARGKPFEIGIQTPFEEGHQEIIGSLEVSDLSLVSSGLYERFFIHDDDFYHHILDARTGYPVESELLSVTIASPSSIQADALSTLCFLLGQEEGMALVEGLPQVEAVFLEADNTMTWSSGLEGRYKPAIQP